MPVKKQIVWFEEVGKDDVGLVGGKGANLGEMTNANLPVPYGFIITSSSYFDFISNARIENKIKDILSIINYDSPNELNQASSQIKELFLSAEIPSQLAHKIVSYYEQLKIKEEKYFSKKFLSINQGIETFKHLYKPSIVAIRSSATAEDLPSASFAGQQDTYLNIQGESSLLNNVKNCWASLFTPRAIYYRQQQGFKNIKVGLAVIVQRMVQSEMSGIAFSLDPMNNDKTKIVIEAIFGLGEYIVGGKVTPDHYEIDKRSFVILKKEVKSQKIALKKSGLLNKELKLNKMDGQKQKLSNEEIIKLAMLVKDIENHYFFPQDIEWAIEKGRIYIVQSRPITTIKNIQPSVISDKAKTEKLAIDNRRPISEDQKPILTGSPASPGIATGPVKIIYSSKELDKIRRGDILVAPQTNPEYVPAMKKAAAIITDKGGRTSHAAIVSRELGIPAVVGTEKATKNLKNEMIISVNGATGEIFKGSIKSYPQDNKSHPQSVQAQKLKTKTKVYVNLAEPDQANKIAKMNVDGVGLLRAEFMIAQIGMHPKEFIRQKKQHLFINKLAKDLSIFVKAFSPRPIVYRATDFKTNEYRDLKGGKAYEPQEENPMLGFRGAYRYIVNPDVFQLELEAVKKVYQLGHKNLHLMIPFVRVPWELIKVKELVNLSGVTKFSGFELLIMVEVPSCALNLEEFIKIGIDGVSIGTNDLTMMLLGVDRDNEEVSQIYDERNPIVVKVLKDVVSMCSDKKITSSICGQAASDYPDLVEELVQAGITSVSVNPDAIDRTREIIYSIEKKIYGKN